MPASAATGEDGFPILYASHADGAHKCEIVGKYGAYQDVVFADIITSEVTPSDYYSYGQVEVICQHIVGSTATDVQCANVDEHGEISSAQPNSEVPTPEFVCGHQYGPCATDRNYIQTNKLLEYNYISNSGCGEDPNTIRDMWMIVLQGTQIELPVVAKFVTLEAGSGANDGSSFSSGHYYVCA
jgi:hypothetical protein